MPRLVSWILLRSFAAARAGDIGGDVIVAAAFVAVAVVAYAAYCAYAAYAVHADVV